MPRCPTLLNSCRRLLLPIPSAGLLCTALLWIDPARLLLLAGADPSLLPLAQPYLFTRAVAAPLTILVLALQSAYSAAMDNATPMKVRVDPCLCVKGQGFSAQQLWGGRECGGQQQRQHWGTSSSDQPGHLRLDTPSALEYRRLSTCVTLQAIFAGAVANFVGDYVAINVLNQGTAGAGIATIFCELVSVGIMAHAMFTRDREKFGLEALFGGRRKAGKDLSFLPMRKSKVGRGLATAG